jgi:hypothetical protein
LYFDLRRDLEFYRLFAAEHSDIGSFEQVAEKFPIGIRLRAQGLKPSFIP